MNRIHVRGLALVLCALTRVAPASASLTPAATPAEDARAILIERDQRHRPKSEEYIGEVIVVSKEGKERRKTWRSYRSGPPGDSDRLIRFLSPPDVRGVGYLAHFRRGKDPDEWLYLPSMKRERRIGVRDREATFASTSFSYEDLDLLEFDETRYDAALLPSQVVDGAPAHVIALTPRVASAYSRKILTLRKDDLRLLTVDFFVAADRAPVKRLTLAGYTTVSGYQIPTRIEMAALRKGGHTTILLRDVVLDRAQPRDRYTIQNLQREDDDGTPVGHGRAAPSRQAWTAPAGPSSARSLRLPGGFSGYAEGRSFGFFGQAATRDSTVWGTIFLRQTARIGPARLTGAVRFESSSSPQVGPLRFDPADRDPRRSPISIRELSLVIPIRPGLDVQVGRFQTTWGETDGYSPSDAFLPRDLSDPLTEERLPLVGASLRGEFRGVRLELLAVPTTTPWRLPALGGRESPFASIDVFLVERPWTVPRGGFGAARVMGTMRGWDLSAWTRAGVRPAPVLDPDLDAVDPDSDVLVVPLNRHFADEYAAGASLSKAYGGWVIHNELGVFRSDDPLLGNAVIWTIGGSRIVGDGTFTGTVAMNAVEPPVNPLLSFDRALLPCVILAVRENESWGNWGAAWVGTGRTVGGLLAAEVAKDLTDIVKITVGADLPHGAALSPASAFSGGQRVRAALRWSW